MNLVSKAALCILVLMVTACHYPNREVTNGGEAATIEFIGDYGNATLSVNGVELGEIKEILSKNEKLEVPGGANKIVVTRQGAVLFDADIFLTAGQNKQITLAN